MATIRIRPKEQLGVARLGVETLLNHWGYKVENDGTKLVISEKGGDSVKLQEAQKKALELALAAFDQVEITD